MTRATHGRAVHIAGRMVSLIVPSAGRERVYVSYRHVAPLA